MRITDAYIEQAQKHKYDLDKPYLLNGPVDLVFYVSPSARSDQTIIKDGGAEKIFIEGTKDNILSLVERIFKMRDDIY